MYQPPAFKEDRPDVLKKLVKQHPLAMLACNGAPVPIVNHLPMIWDEADRSPRLLAHLAKGNGLIKDATEGQEALAIFQGPTHYITPNWYPGKKEHGKEVPTYNYMVAHLRGTLHFYEDADWLLAQLNQLTDQMESGRAAPWSVGDAPEAFTARQLKGIYGVELRVTEMVGKWKVSQNRAPVDRQGVVQGLRQEGDDEARQMADLIASKL
ncbi:FMN-binding negative transcriptional regulator [Maritalea mediterranea]|uniref:FMN-binding negative transcriptional regulator n=1 Tax=Maritalea mediterranea TaxID=2909667 RepID=A0ABS9EC00_9HYPH|nr:FMN-binding negative transcriptional regulator [Maritalea mediterranea]MCF4099712.1 FMN-binding negative transcriptional regulator [Maritalea mediterranea]